ncbi:response regulator transcription factor [Ferrimonas aestuarii]|uniref:Phosphate regulon transcriptional regulatory protein PhoB n=1 Tax=Ferrimonas aestuarii TaxID=2569539 RepID=A0A4U1BKM4_9GAMM|nr:response regulator transcription factor [Ferrimonas aestuarii]TKB53045.1 response regulator transcription factor [Ferrimonas aestuarii]
MATLLVIEDDADINALVSMQLEANNHQVRRCRDGRQGYQLAKTGQFDLIVLDLMLPSMDGLSICQSLRQEGCITPILMLTARTSEIDRVVGLESGADDYMTKPFSVRELQARVKSHLRRSQLLAQPVDTQSVQLGPLRLDPEKRSTQLNGDHIDLTSTEFDLLWYLAQRPGRVFKREQLLEAVWGYQHNGYQHTVNSHINRLRAKLERDPANPKLVLTVWGVGYKFNDKI